jgi:hypothetical protein
MFYTHWISRVAHLEAVKKKKKNKKKKKKKQVPANQILMFSLGFLQ